MQHRSSAMGRTGIRGLGLAILCLAVSACDLVDAAIAPSEAALERETSATTARDPEQGDMQSIGPDSAQRVYYQFVDDAGRVQFVERLSEVPIAWRAQMGYVEMSQPPPLSPEEARRSWRISNERATQIMLAAQKTPVGWTGGDGEEVILYSATWCGYCTKARAHLDGAGIHYELRDVDNPAVGRELREKTGRGGIPVLDFSGEILRGYSADQYDRAIRAIQG